MLLNASYMLLSVNDLESEACFFKKKKRGKVNKC